VDIWDVDGGYRCNFVLFLFISLFAIMDMNMDIAQRLNSHFLLRWHTLTVVKLGLGRKIIAGISSRVHL